MYILRFGHIFAGILWIGLLYYFNFVQVPSFAKFEGPVRQNVIMILVPRALLFFRYAALATVLFGLAYIFSMGAIKGNDYYKSFQFRAIAFGGALGLIMAYNVWFIIWPNQKKVIAATTATLKEGKPAPPEQPKWTRNALLASRTNLMLSIPMLFFMIVARHLTSLWAK
ncbi:MAG: hypothetical protein FJ039_10330 [Chloroflexi bacterium]|nr:hypothetical protein [Chloroflexota bacterium]